MKYLKILAVVLFSLIMLGCSKEDDSAPSTNYITPNDFLAAKKYKKLVVEIDYMSGNKPTEAAIDNVVTFISERLNKPKGIEVVLKSIPAAGVNAYSVTDINKIEAAHRDYFPIGDLLVAYVVFVDGGYIQDTENSKVLGIAYGNTSMALFEKSIKDYSGGVTQPSQATLETAVINHEFGHTLGLVNNGTPLQSNHQDVGNGHHCDDTNCLMYYTAETSDIVANLIGNNIPKLDDDCIADLRANGGK